MKKIRRNVNWEKFEGFKLFSFCPNCGNKMRARAGQIVFSDGESMCNVIICTSCGTVVKSQER